MSKELPHLFKKTGPWAERIIPLQFLSHLHEIDEQRLILTLWSRIQGGLLRCPGVETH